MVELIILINILSIDVQNPFPNDLIIKYYYKLSNIKRYSFLNHINTSC